MDCNRMEALLSAYLDGEVNAAEAAQVETHLASCPACGALYAELAEMDAELGGLAVAAPDTLIPLVLKTIKPRRPLAHWRRLAGMAAMFAVVLAGVWSVRTLAPGGQQGFLAMPDALRTELPAASEDEGEASKALLPAPYAAAEKQFAAQAPEPIEYALIAESSTEAEAGNGEAVPQPASSEAVTAQPPAPEGSQDQAQDEITYIDAPLSAPAPRRTEGQEDGMLAVSGGETASGGAHEVFPTADAGPPTEAGPAAAPSMARMFAPPADEPMATMLTAAEAEGILRSHLGEGAQVQHVGLIAEGAYHCFDSADGEVYAVAAADGQIIQKGSPEGDEIPDWPPAES